MCFLWGTNPHFYIPWCIGWYAWRKWRVLVRIIWFISTSVTISLNYNQYSAITDLHNLQFTVAHALGFSVSTSLVPVTELDTETSASDHYEVFSPFLVQSLWNLGNDQKLFWTCKYTALPACARNKVKSKLCYDRRSVGQAPTAAYDQIFVTVRYLRVCWCGALSLTKEWVCHL
jgi:hypothetical protein